MQDPRPKYEENLIRYHEQLSKIKKRLTTSSMIRLVIFLAACAGIYFAWGNMQLLIAIVIVAVVLFIFLVSKHGDLQYRRDFLQELIRINEVELIVLDRDFHGLPSGEKFKNPAHDFSLDIDLFGRGSFFQYLNRTSLSAGEELLASILTKNSIDNISRKQEAIQELAEMSEWRQQFSATAALVKTNTSVAFITQWLKNYKPYVPKVMRLLPLLFSVVSVALFAAYYFDVISGYFVAFWFFIGLFITGAFVKKTNQLSQDTSKLQSTFEQYYKLLLQLETTDFNAPFLQEQMQHITPENDKKASAILKQFSKQLSALDQRSNMLVGALINGFFLSDLRQGHNIEQWVKANAQNVERWFRVIAFFDAYNSLGNYAHNHPEYFFPDIAQGKNVIDSKAVAHPLLDPQKAVANDFKIGKEQFFIITGANMAGKSTFLRTVSLQIVMANVGLPVCAASAKYSPIKLITSMRTTDSLTDDESYFFSELKRLQYIVEAIKTDQYFIILDEILKGTNSTDKAIGSRKFIEKLVGSNSTGIIATHDLSLCEASEILPQVKNYYFDAQIVNNELFFDYTFKNGICQNMNASFLLEKMGIV